MEICMGNYRWLMKLNLLAVNFFGVFALAASEPANDTEPVFLTKQIRVTKSWTDGLLLTKKLNLVEDTKIVELDIWIPSVPYNFNLQNDAAFFKIGSGKLLKAYLAYASTGRFEELLGLYTVESQKKNLEYFANDSAIRKQWETIQLSLKSLVIIGAWKINEDDYVYYAQYPTAVPFPLTFRTVKTDTGWRLESVRLGTWDAPESVR